MAEFDQQALYPVEYLSSLTLRGLSPHTHSSTQPY